MSGICGIVGRGRNVDVRDVVTKMMEAGAHRGPDGRSMYVGEGVALGHLMLKLHPLDRDCFQSPSVDAGTLRITMDGVLFNRDELIGWLGEAGHRSGEQGDAALFLAAFRKSGPECLKRIDGTFAVAIWDEAGKTLFCARDPIGVRPFFHAFHEGSFLFGSELQQLLCVPGFRRKPNERMIGDFLASEVDLRQGTFFENVHRLPPGCFAWVREGTLQVTPYWDIDPARRTNLKGDDACGERFRDLFTKAVRKNLHAGLPVGCNLSGGLDSSSIVCVADRLRKSDGAVSPLPTFSLTFGDKACDESPHIKAVSDVTNIAHNGYNADDDDLFAHIRTVQDRQAEPFRSIGVVLFWRLKEIAARKGVKVLLNGMGADEILGSINLYYLADMVKQGQWRTLKRTLNALAASDPYELGLTPRQYLMRFGIRPLIPPKLAALRKRLKGSPYPDWIDPSFAQRIDLENRITAHRRRIFRELFQQCSYDCMRHEYTPLLLHYEDANNAGFGIESRFPFIDKDLVEFLFSLPTGQKIRDTVTKIVLRNGMKGILPESIRTRTDKGFINRRIDHWLRNQYASQVDETLRGKALGDLGVLRIPRILELFEKYKWDPNLRLTIWKAYILGVWYERFF
jgi:asparagine synthase (glutamine-hydrolysing)